MSRDRAALLLVLAVALALWLPRLEGPIDLRYDAGAYYVLGTALAEGRGYRLLNEPGAIEAVQYPPLLPLFVAAHQRILGTADPVLVGGALRVSFCMLSLGYAAATWFLARRLLATGPALVATLLTSLSLYTYFLSDLCFAEIPFALVTTLFLLAARQPRSRGFVLSAALGAAAVLLRTAGVALLAAWVAESLLARQYRQALLRAAVAAVPMLLWHAHIEAVRRGPEYLRPAYAYQRAPYQYYNVSYAENATLVDPFRPEQGHASPAAVLQRVRTNLRTLPPRLGEAVSTPERFWKWSLYLVSQHLGVADVRLRLARVPMIALGLLVAIGLAGLAFRGERLIPLYVAASLALIVLTPWPEQYVRYLATLTPVLALSLVTTVERGLAWSRRARPSLRNTALAAVAALGAVVAGLQSFALWKSFTEFHNRIAWLDPDGQAVPGRLFYYDDAWVAFDTALGWLARRAGREDVVATSAPHLAHLRTGCASVMPPLEVDPRAAQTLLDGIPAGWLVIDDLAFTDVSRRYAAPVVEAHPTLWTLAYQDPVRGAPRIYRRAGR